VTPDFADGNAKSPCDKDAEEYSMRHPRRGVALIFNHEKFDNMDPRSGSAKDCANLSTQLKNLGFETRCHQDLTFTELSAVLRESKITNWASYLLSVSDQYSISH
jgi:hypothetical protein